MGNPIKAKLTKEDIVILKQNFNQRIIFLFSICLIYFFVCLSIIAILELTKTSYSKFMIISAMALLYGIYVYTQLFPRWKEIENGHLLIEYKIIEKKEIKQHYLYTTSLLNDITKQPKIVNYFLISDSIPIEVEKTLFEEFNVNDQMAIHFSIRNKQIIRLSKVK